MKTATSLTKQISLLKFSFARCNVKNCQFMERYLIDWHKLVYQRVLIFLKMISGKDRMKLLKNHQYLGDVHKKF